MDEKKYIIAIDIGGTDIKGAIVDCCTQILHKKTIKTLANRDSEAILKDIDLLISELESQIENIDDFLGIGIITPGYPDKNGIIPLDSIPNIPVLSDYPIKKYLTKNRELPIRFENDGNAAAYGEYIFGQKKICKNIIVLVLGTGVGSGVIIDGRILKGKNKISGELSHITLDPDGPECCCGKKGCLEAYFSGKAIPRIAREELSRDNQSSLNKYEIDKLDPVLIEKEAKNGDKLSKRVYEVSGKWLGIAISNYINIFNPEKIILSGGLSRACYLFWDSMIEEVVKNTYSLYSRGIVIEVSKFIENSGIIGAASLFF
jgi:glucokinase